MEMIVIFGAVIFLGFLLSGAGKRSGKRKYKPRKIQQTITDYRPENTENRSKTEEWLEQGLKVYRGRTHLMTPTERRFYHFVQRKFGADKRVFAQVRVIDVMNVNWSVIRKGSFDEQVAFRQVSQWHVDYVVTDIDFKIICAVELDDKSHSEPERVRRDWILNKAFESAGVTLHRFELKENDERINDPAYINF